MSMTLYAHSMKKSLKLLVIFIAILSLYASIIVSMYDPEMNEGLELMMQSMPGIFEALGMDGTGGTLPEFIANYLYSFLLIVFPLIFISLITLSLVAKLVDTGSMACLLATPNSRAKIIVTQLFTVLTGVFIIVFYVFSLVSILSHSIFPGELDVLEYAVLNAGLFCMLTFFVGVCFCASCIFDDTMNASIYGAGPCVLFILIDMAANVSDDLSFLNYATPLSLFDTAGILASDTSAFFGMGALFVMGICLCITGCTVFCKRNIHV